MIEITNLDFSYPRKRQVYKDLNLSIKEGSICGLLGLNGAGKTTLLNLIAGFLIPQDGSCKIFNREASKREPEMLKEIFFVSDTSNIPYPTISAFCKLFAGFYPRFDKDFFELCMSEFKVSSFTNLRDLSFGDKHKAMLSFALTTRCRLLLFDEPTNGLDIPSKATFRKLVASSLGENQMIVMATHQLRDLDTLMDRIVIEHQGQIVLNESIGRISENLLFGINENLIVKEDLLYVTNSFARNQTVSINQTNQPGQVDIELLFNAAISNPNELSTIFTPKN